jgi:uncharacterized protein (DUF302 family)
MGYALGRTVPGSYPEAVEAVRDALAEQGFGVLTEIDIQATLKAKLDVDVPAQVILGACRPPLAHEALQAEPSIGLLLPCNVTVREADGGTRVEAMDPTAMVTLTGNDALRGVADDARARLEKALAALPA